MIDHVFDGRTYSYRVRACQGYSDCGPFSAVVSASVLGPTMPKKHFLNATDSTYCDRVQLTWDAGCSLEVYYVDRGLSPDNLQPLGQTTSTSWADTSAMPGVTYYYGVYGEVETPGWGVCITDWSDIVQGRKGISPSCADATGMPTSVLNPALAIYNAQVYLACTEDDAAGTLTLMRSTDGVTFRDKIELPEYSRCAPALRAYKNGLVLAWTGTDSYLNLLAWRDSEPWAASSFIALLAGGKTLGEWSNVSPAVETNGNVVYLAWTGGDGRLNVMSSPDGTAFGSKVLVVDHTKSPAPFYHSDYAPALQWFGDQLYIAFTEKAPFKNQQTLRILRSPSGARSGDDFVVASTAPLPAGYAAWSGSALSVVSAGDLAHGNVRTELELSAVVQFTDLVFTAFSHSRDGSTFAEDTLLLPSDISNYQYPPALAGPWIAWDGEGGVIRVARIAHIQ